MASGMNQDTERDSGSLATRNAVKTESSVTKTNETCYTTGNDPAPYTIPSHPRAINVRRLCALLWRMYMEVPLNDEHTALLGDIIETVGMQLAGGELYTSDVREAYEEVNRHNATLDAPTLREELLFDYPALVAASDVMSITEAQRLGIGEHAPDGPDIDCQDDYEYFTGTGRYAEPPQVSRCDLCKKETSDLKECSKCGAWCCYLDWWPEDGDYGTVLCDNCDFDKLWQEGSVTR